MPRNTRGGRNNNPSGRNQYSNGWIDTAKERPIATAAAAAAAVGAGVFLWSRRNQISDQISSLGDQVTNWAEGMSSSNGNADQSDNGTGSSSGSSRSRMGASGSSGSGKGSNRPPVSRRSGGKGGRGAMDEIGVIEVETVSI
jgi:hypothetical protein